MIAPPAGVHANVSVAGTRTSVLEGATVGCTLVVGGAVVGGTAVVAVTVVVAATVLVVGERAVVVAATEIVGGFASLVGEATVVDGSGVDFGAVSRTIGSVAGGRVGEPCHEITAAAAAATPAVAVATTTANNAARPMTRRRGLPAERSIDLRRRSSCSTNTESIGGVAASASR